MNKFRVYLGYTIGCMGCLIGGLTYGHLAAMRKYASPEDIVKIGCKNQNPLCSSYPKYTKNVLKDAKELFMEGI